MATLTVRNLDDDVVRRLRVRAAENRRSAEEEHRVILREALADPAASRETIMSRLQAFRQETARPGSVIAVDDRRELRAARMDQLSPVREG